MQHVNRRRFLQLGTAGLVVVGGGGFAASRFLTGPTPTGAGADAFAATETAVRELPAAPTTVDPAGRLVQTWAYDGVVPGKEF